MRLRDMAAIIEANIDGLSVSMAGENSVGGVQMVSLTRNRSEIVETVRALSKIPSFYDSSVKVLANTLFREPDRLLAEVRVAQKVINDIAELRRECFVLLRALGDVLPAQDPLSISVLIPPVQTLDDFAEVIKDLQLVFEHPLRRLLNTSVSFQNVDTGSTWLELVFEYGPKAVDMAAKLIDAALKIAKWRKERRESIKALADMSPPEVTKLLESNVEDESKRSAEAAAEQLVAQFGEDKDAAQTNEDAVVVAVAIVVMVKLNERGARVVRALNAPSDSAAVSPDGEPFTLAPTMQDYAVLEASAEPIAQLPEANSPVSEP